MRRVLGVLLLAGVVLAGCGNNKADDGIATAGNPAANGANPSPTAMDNAERGRKFAQCMRENGIPMEDPEVGDDGKFQIKIGGPGKGTGGPEMSKEKADAAMAACKQYMPNGGAVGKLDPEMVEKMRAYAVCMRENGAPDFPDPDENGMIRLERRPGGDDAAFEAATKKCQELAPKMVTKTK